MENKTPGGLRLWVSVDAIGRRTNEGVRDGTDWGSEVTVFRSLAIHSLLHGIAGASHCFLLKLNRCR